MSSQAADEDLGSFVVVDNDLADVSGRFGTVEVEWKYPDSFTKYEFANYQGRLQISDAAGRRVFTTPEVTADCHYEDCLITRTSIFGFKWDGKNSAGTRPPPGRYPVVFEVRRQGTEKWLRPKAPGGYYYYYFINKLVTRTQTLVIPAAHIAERYSFYGKCPSAPSPGPHCWRWSVAVLSLSRCRDASATNDWMFRTFDVHSDTGRGTNRLISFRADVYGAPIRAGMTGSVVYDEPWRKPSTYGGVWVKRITLKGRMGWKNGPTVKWDPRYAMPYDGAGGETQWGGPFYAPIQVRVTNGNKWDLKYIRGTWVYRAWSR